MSEEDALPIRPRIRTRKGCLTCRKRRRKCDEEKPRCKNCTKKGYTCRYGVNLTFLATNTRGLLRGDLQAFRNATPKSFEQIRFIDGLHDSDDGVLGIHPEIHQKSGSSETSVNETLLPYHIVGGDPLPTNNNVNPAGHASETLPGRFNEEPMGDKYDHPFLGSPSKNGSSDDTTSQSQLSALAFTPNSIPSSGIWRSPNAEDEDTALGPEHDRQTVRQTLYASQHSEVCTDSQPGADKSVSRLPQQSIVSQASEVCPPYQFMPAERPLSTDEHNGLLKWYIDEVAPWLDIMSHELSFAIRLPLLATSYQPLLSAIMALASCHRSLLQPHVHVNGLQNMDLIHFATTLVRPDSYSIREEAVAARILLTVCNVLPLGIQHWRDILNDQIEILSSHEISGYSEGSHGVASWAILRLDLALALLSGSPVMTPIDTWHTASTPFWDSLTSPSPSNSASEAIRSATLLCTFAVQLFASQEPVNHEALSLETKAWTRLWTSTLSWLQKLPPSMKPILTSPIPSLPTVFPFSYPLVLHTSRENLYAAVMYHTICLLLLLRKSPFYRQGSQLKTPTWHAVQICANCLGNKSSWSWDPTILAALLHAGSFISYYRQQTELLAFLNKATEGSGWKIYGQIEELMEKWKIDGAVQ